MRRISIVIEQLEFASFKIRRLYTYINPNLINRSLYITHTTYFLNIREYITTRVFVEYNYLLYQ
jgi:hypothetical protein